MPLWEAHDGQVAELKARLKAMRARLGVTQVEFAALVGVNVSTVRAWEQGLRRASPMALRAIERLETAP